MSRFKTAPVNKADGAWKIARRKGKRVRYQNSVTAKMTGWCASPEYLGEMTAGVAQSMREAGKAAQDTAKAITILDNAREAADASLKRMTVAELRALAGDRGIKVPSKARKAAIIDALTASV